MSLSGPERAVVVELQRLEADLRAASSPRNDPEIRLALNSLHAQTTFLRNMAKQDLVQVVYHKAPAFPRLWRIGFTHGPTFRIEYPQKRFLEWRIRSEPSQAHGGGSAALAAASMAPQQQDFGIGAATEVMNFDDVREPEPVLSQPMTAAMRQGYPGTHAQQGQMGPPAVPHTSHATYPGSSMAPPPIDRNATSFPASPSRSGQTTPGQKRARSDTASTSGVPHKTHQRVTSQNQQSGSHQAHQRAPSQMQESVLARSVFDEDPAAQKNPGDTDARPENAIISMKGFIRNPAGQMIEVNTWRRARAEQLGLTREQYWVHINSMNSQTRRREYEAAIRATQRQQEEAMRQAQEEEEEEFMQQQPNWVTGQSSRASKVSGANVSASASATQSRAVSRAAGRTPSRRTQGVFQQPGGSDELQQQVSSNAAWEAPSSPSWQAALGPPQQSTPGPSRYHATLGPMQQQASPGPSRQPNTPGRSRNQTPRGRSRQRMTSGPSQYQPSLGPSRQQLISAPSQYQASPSRSRQQINPDPSLYQTTPSQQQAVPDPSLYQANPDPEQEGISPKSQQPPLPVPTRLTTEAEANDAYLKDHHDAFMANMRQRRGAISAFPPRGSSLGYSQQGQPPRPTSTIEGVPAGYQVPQQARSMTTGHLQHVQSAADQQSYSTPLQLSPVLEHAANVQQSHQQQQSQQQLQQSRPVSPFERPISIQQPQPIQPRRLSQLSGIGSQSHPGPQVGTPPDLSGSPAPENMSQISRMSISSNWKHLLDDMTMPTGLENVGENDLFGSLGDMSDLGGFATGLSPTQEFASIDGVLTGQPSAFDADPAPGKGSRDELEPDFSRERDETQVEPSEQEHHRGPENSSGN